MGGRGASALNRTPTKTVTAAQQPQQASQPQPAPQQQPAPQVAAAVSHDSIDWDNMQFPELTQSEYNEIYSNNRDHYTGNVKMAKKMYEADVNVKGPGNAYSYAQDMNNRLNAGKPLDADGKFMNKYLTQGLHPIGKSCTMTRAAHDTLLNQMIAKAGLRGNYGNFSEAQLKSALVGGEFSMKSFGSFSTSTGANPFAGLGSRELVIKARTAPSTKVVQGAKSQHECITGVGQKMRVTDIKVTNNWVYPRTGGRKRVVELYVDMW